MRNTPLTNTVTRGGRGGGIVLISMLALISIRLCVKKMGKKMERIRTKGKIKRGLMSAEYSQKHQCPHLGTSTTSAGHRQRGRETGRGEKERKQVRK